MASSCVLEERSQFLPSLSLEQKEGFLTEDEFYSNEKPYNIQLNFSTERPEKHPSTYIEYIHERVKKGLFLEEISFFFLGDINSSKLSLDEQINRIIEKYENCNRNEFSYKLFIENGGNEISVSYTTDTAVCVMCLKKCIVNNTVVFLPTENIPIGTINSEIPEAGQIKGPQNGTRVRKMRPNR
jgi:hypothetical protein